MMNWLDVQCVTGWLSAGIVPEVWSGNKVKEVDGIELCIHWSAIKYTNLIQRRVPDWFWSFSRENVEQESIF